LDADAIVDRRRLRRKLTFWRVAAAAVVLLAIAGAVFAFNSGRFTRPGDYIARIRIEGLIRNNQDRVEALARLSRSRARAVIVHIDSPGGIIAEDTSLVGSIGVLFQFPNFTDVLKTIGVKVESIKSSPLKAAPNGFEPTSPEARAAIESVVLDSYAWFKNLVQTRRQMSDQQLAAVSDGRVFTGRQAAPLKLVDGIGNEKTALA